MPDIFDTIRARDNAPAPVRTKPAIRYQIAYGGTATQSSKFSRRLYTFRQARRIVARLERRGVPAYASALHIRVPVAG